MESVIDIVPPVNTEEYRKKYPRFSDLDVLPRSKFFYIIVEFSNNQIIIKKSKYFPVEVIDRSIREMLTKYSHNIEIENEDISGLYNIKINDSRDKIEYFFKEIMKKIKTYRYELEN